MLINIRQWLTLIAFFVGALGLAYVGHTIKSNTLLKAEVARLERVVEAEQKRAAVLDKMLQVRKQREQEKQEHVRLDQEALATVQDWASAPVPDAIRERLLAD